MKRPHGVAGYVVAYRVRYMFLDSEEHTVQHALSALKCDMIVNNYGFFTI